MTKMEILAMNGLVMRKQQIEEGQRALEADLGEMAAAIEERLELEPGSVRDGKYRINLDTGCVEETPISA